MDRRNKRKGFSYRNSKGNESKPKAVRLYESVEDERMTDDGPEVTINFRKQQVILQWSRATRDAVFDLPKHAARSSRRRVFPVTGNRVVDVSDTDEQAVPIDCIDLSASDDDTTDGIVSSDVNQWQECSPSTTEQSDVHFFNAEMDDEESNIAETASDAPASDSEPVEQNAASITIPKGIEVQNRVEQSWLEPTSASTSSDRSGSLDDNEGSSLASGEPNLTYLTHNNVQKRKPGAVASCEVAYYQSTSHLLIPHDVFVKEVQKALVTVLQTMEGNAGGRWEHEALEALHQAAEEYLVDVFKESATLAKHAKRATIMKEDIQLACQRLLPLEVAEDDS